MSGFFQFLIRLDRSVFHSINSIAGKNSVVDWFARAGADDHIVPLARESGRGARSHPATADDDHMH